MFDALIFAALMPENQWGGSEEPEEIVVSGERVQRPLHETASSVAVLDPELLEEMAAPDRVEHALAMVPNVQFGSGGEGPTIRGQDSTGVVRDLPAFLSGVRPRATITIDGRTVSYYELAFGLTSIWDAAKIEVFRSPQTTTQGRNSIGGAIFVETGDPTFEWEGRARLIGGDYDTRQVSVVVSGPLMDGQVAARISGDLRRSRTSNHITTAARGISNPNRDESEVIRVKLQARPGALSDVHLSLAYSHGRSQMPQIEGIMPPYEARRYPNATYGVFSVNVDSLTGAIVYAPAGEIEVRATVGLGSADVRRHAPPGLGEAKISTHDLSIEPIVTWRSGGSRFSSGLHFTRATLDQAIDISALQQGVGTFDDVQTSLGVFGEAAVPIAPRFELTAGLRYQWDRQVRQGGLRGGLTRLPLEYDGRFAVWLPKISLAWDLTPDLRFGILAQRAANPGGVNLNTARARVETFGAERLWAVEAFARARIAGGRLTLLATAFNYWMADAQRTQTVTFVTPTGLIGTTAQVDNAPRARSQGFELEARWQVSKRLQLRAAAGLLDTRITRTIISTDPMLGRRFQRSPVFTGSASIAWQPIETVHVSTQVRHHSGYYSDDLETAARWVRPGTIVDGRVDWNHRRFTVFGYARNLFDEFNLSYIFANGLATADDPRELGMGIAAQF